MEAKPYYSFDWGTAHFTLIDSDIANAGATQVERDAFWQKETRWLEEDLRSAQGADCVISQHRILVRLGEGSEGTFSAWISS